MPSDIKWLFLACFLLNRGVNTKNYAVKGVYHENEKINYGIRSYP